MKKIEYKTPDMEIVEIKTRLALLQASEGGVDKDPDPVEY